MTSPRLLTIWCADWPVVAATLVSGAPHGGPVDPSGPAAGAPMAVLHANRIVARSPAAARQGVEVGQRRRDAQRCCPDLVLVHHDPGRDAREFEPVIRAVADLAPRLDVIEPGWITLAARGPSRYFGGETAVAERLIDIVRHLLGDAASVGVGVADGRMASAIAARRAVATAAATDDTGPRVRSGPAAGVGVGAGTGVVVVPPDGSAGFLAPLPLGWLGVVGDADAVMLDVWRRLGLRTLGDLAALSSADVLARFGRAGAHAHRLAAGLDARPPVAVDPPRQRRHERVFEEPVLQVPPVVFVAKQLADEMVAGLAAEGRVCTRLLVVAETEHGERSERSWYRSGGLSAAAVVERVRWQLEGWVNRPDADISAGISMIRLVPDEVRADDGVQMGLWGGRSRADHDAARAITRLVGIAGDEAVLVPAWRGGRLPAERYRWVPASSVDLDDPGSRLTADPGPWPGATPSPSPTMVLDEPVPVDLLDAAGELVRVGGRGEIGSDPAVLVLGGDRHPADRRPVVAWAGPWPLDQVWWDPRRRRRGARLQVVTDDGAAHLLMVEQQRWWCLARYC